MSRWELVRDVRTAGRVGRVVALSVLAGCVIVQWHGSDGCNVVRSEWLRPAVRLKLCL